MKIRNRRSEMLKLETNSKRIIKGILKFMVYVKVYILLYIIRCHINNFTNSKPKLFSVGFRGRFDVDF